MRLHEAPNDAHEHVLELGFYFDVYIGYELIDMCVKFFIMDKARQVLDKMPKRD